VERTGVVSLRSRNLLDGKLLPPERVGRLSLANTDVGKMSVSPVDTVGSRQFRPIILRSSAQITRKSRCCDTHIPRVRPICRLGDVVISLSVSA